MGRIFLVAAAVVILTASWAAAGNFEVLAEAGVVKAPTPLHIMPGTPVKAEFKSSLRTASDVDLESDSLLPEKVAAKAEPKVTPKPAIAFRERSRAMAPPPRMNPAPESRIGAMAEGREESSDLEGDLEKDLVLSPPPPRTNERKDLEVITEPEVKPEKERPVLSDKKAAKRAEKKKAAPRVKPMTPSDYDHYAAGAKPIRKVRPVSSNPWSVPAGSYENSCCPVSPRGLTSQPRGTAHREYAPANAPYPQSRHGLITPPTGDRIVRDGVTIKLAPAAAAPGQPYPDDEQGSDFFSTAAEIIGLPFAFISSFF